MSTTNGTTTTFLQLRNNNGVEQNVEQNVEQKNEDQMATGITTMIFVSCLSSMAGVYNEKLVKGTKANVW